MSRTKVQSCTSAPAHTDCTKQFMSGGRVVGWVNGVCSRDTSPSLVSETPMPAERLCHDRNHVSIEASFCILCLQGVL